MEKHSIQIDEKLYNEIQSYCKSNGEKITTFCSDLLRKGLMEKKYGDIPFGKIIQSIQDVTEYYNDISEKEDETKTIIENVGGPDKYNDIISECIFGKDEPKEKKEITQEQVYTSPLEEIKVVSTKSKRRL